LAGLTGILTRPAQAEEPFPVRVAEAQDGKLVIPALGPDMQRAITLVGVSAQADIVDLQVTLGPLSRQDAQLIVSETLACGGCGGGLRLARGAWIPLTLTGRGLGPGTYNSFLQVTVLTATTAVTSTSVVTATTVIPIVISRGPMTLTTQIITTSGWAATQLGGGAQFAVDVRETSGRDTVIRMPSISPLQVETQKGVWKGVEELQFRPVAIMPAGTTSGAAGAPPTVTLPAGTYTRFIVDFGNLPSGSYKGQIRVNSLEGAEQVQDFQLALKDHWLWPFLVITAGVLGGYLLKRWTQGERDRLLRRRRILVERERVEKERATSGAKPDPVWDHLLSALATLLDANSYALPGGSETDASVKTQLDDLGKRRVAYVLLLDLKRRIDALLAALPDGMTDAKARLARQAGDQMRTAIARLTSADTIDKLDEELQKTFNEIRKAAIEAPAARLEIDLKAMPEDEAKTAKAIGVAADPSVKTASDAALKTLAEARALAEANQFERAVELLEWIRASLFDMRRAQIERFKRELIRKAQSGGTDFAKLNPWVEATDRALLAAIGEGPTEKGLNLLADATEKFNEALTEYQKLVPPPVGHKDSSEGAEAAWNTKGGVFGQMQTVGRHISAFLFGDSLPARTETASSIADKVRFFDGVVVLVVVLAAGLTGLISQYVDAPAFGGRDYITAFLWGFGWQSLTSTLTSLATEAGLIKGSTQAPGGAGS
jgi:hypothetical protein